MPPLVLTGAGLIDGTGAEPVRGRAVVVEDGRIARVSDEGALPKGERRDLSGHTLLPGLINPHGSLVPELTLMVKNGMTPLQAIHSATGVAAEALGLGADIGRIAPGHAADLIAVAGDPAERIEALDDLRLVLARGRIVRNDVWPQGHRTERRHDA